MSYLIQSARKLVSVFTEQPSPLEIQMAKQLKEQSLQMEEMKQLMEGMKTLIAKMEPIVEERKEERKETRKAEEPRLLIVARKAEQKPKPWSCPTDGRVYPWTYKGVKYLRNSDNQIWMHENDECGDWKGLYLVEEDRIDESAIDPYEDEDYEPTKTLEPTKTREPTKTLEPSHAVRQEEARKRSAARIHAGEYSIWNRYETPGGSPQELITKGHHVWASDRTPITVDGAVCWGPRLGSYMGINFAGIHFSLCGISRGCTSFNGVTYDGTVEPRLY